MADNKPSEQLSVALDHFADALRDLCAGIDAETGAAPWPDVGDGVTIEDDYLNKLATLL